MTAEPPTAALLTIARSAIERELGAGAAATPSVSLPPELAQPGAAFVTLTLDAELRGCIGSLEAVRPLAEDVADNARAAAFEDPRFPPLTAGELPDLRIEVSVLSKPEPIDCGSEAELLAALRPGVDGLVLECGAHRATFLPQVWESLPDPASFLEALRRKARLEPGFWSDGLRFSRYTVDKYAER